ncbi:hypothetical protein [Arsenicicoccus dermatophilus]|uniref:hypothetical protein n=1 Tax=Arsenicicoccus dermatophilus TaxID=1076331 RepID=UPI00391745BB
MTPQAPDTTPDWREDWDAWSRPLGTAICPHLERLHDSVPTLIGAMACTDDGLNLAATGIDPSQVGKLAALSSSVFAVAKAHREGIDPTKDVGSTTVNIGDTEFQCVLQRLAVPHLGHILLVLAARDVSLGALLVATRSTGREIRQTLAQHAPAGSSPT